MNPDFFAFLFAVSLFGGFQIIAIIVSEALKKNPCESCVLTIAESLCLRCMGKFCRSCCDDGAISYLGAIDESRRGVDYE